MQFQEQQVEQILGRLHRKEIQKIVKTALDEWEKKNKALTRAILAGLHRVPAPAKDILEKYTPAAILFKPASYLEWAIIKLAEQAARKGTLTEENRKEFEKFISYTRVNLPRRKK